MSKPNSISYGVRPEDDGSDMDVSSDDEGLHMYQSLPNHTQTQVHQDQLPQASQELQPPPAAVPGPESSSSRLTTITNCWTTFVDKVAQHQTPITIRDGASDTDSISSFHTAPNSPIDLTLDDDQDTDMDQRQPPDIITELVSERDRLAQELERHTNEENRIARLLEEKKAKLDAIRVRQLEFQVRKSIQKNRKAVITPAKSKKGKEKAPIDGQYRSYSDSEEEEDTQQPPRKAKAIVGAGSGRPERLPVEEPARVKPNGETAKDKEAQAEAKKSGTKKTDEPQTQRDALTAKEEKTASDPPNCMNLSKLNKQTVQAIRRSQQLGHTSVGQMKMFLCDLYDKFMEDGKLSRIQKVHYKELVKQVSRYDHFGDDHIPGKATPKKAKKLEKKIQPEKRRLLPNEFYGHPKKLNFKNYKVDRQKLLDALTCSEIEAPRILVKARSLLLKNTNQLTLPDFEGLISPEGELIDKEELMMYMGRRKINRLLTLYREAVNRAAPPTPMTMGERTRHDYYLAQRRLEESLMLRQNGTASPEPSTVENPLVSDNSTAALNSVSVSVAPSSRAMGARPITTITYVPTETSFIRSILPGGREPANSSKPMPPKPMPQKPMAVQKSKPLPQAKASKASVSLPPKDPVKNSTPTPVSAQISTIPKNPPSSLKLSDNPSLSASNTPSASSTHPQTSASTNPPPQQNTPSTFQPYRSALDSLGVTSGMDVRHKKTGILCRAESNGGVCNDKSCCDMHFTDFTHT